MKSKNIINRNQDNGNLKSALLKILIDLNIELPEDIDTLKIDTKEEENIELNNLENKE